MAPFRTARRKMQKSRKRRSYGSGKELCGEMCRNSYKSGCLLGWTTRKLRWDRVNGNRLVLIKQCTNCGAVAELADAYLDQK